MTATRPMDLPLPFNIKKEKDERISEIESAEFYSEDNDSMCSLLQPLIFDNDCFSKADAKDEFLQLTSLVRRVYFSYLHKSIINNYNTCCTAIKEKKISKAELKRCASLLELNAVKASLATSLYRQAMLKTISDIKDNTNQRKIHSKLAIFLDSSPKTVDVSVQTSFDVSPIEATYLNMQQNTQSLYNSDIQQFENESKCDVSLLEKNQTNIIDEIEKEIKVNEEDKWDKKDKVELLDTSSNKDDEMNNIEDCKNNNKKVTIVNNSVSDNTNVPDIFDEETLIDVRSTTQNEDQESRDSLIENLENMFGESDDSSDLMTLIEKHSGVSKTNMDKEISKMCTETSTATTKNNASSVKMTKKLEIKENTSVDQQHSGKRKLSFSNYQKLKKRAVDESGNSLPEENKEDLIMKKKKGIWFVERVHQVLKLKNKMMELSVKNYRKHGRLRAKFIELFGESEEEEEMMPESPIHIEEHLTACRERIAPWVVKYLMPYYNKKMIQDRLLFKAVGKHISDMLLIENTFPEEECVNQYIKNFFRNKPIIKSEADIYV
ncbi:uncharacterized protein [Chelonus insularis]|uniref:uncharacterized protein n=1 Tax=Chelonus insularis TaxID=460826 RepID=UPI00158D2EAF|nr:uncharacterized protein LOC118067047 [Chelonus insularis]